MVNIKHVGRSFGPAVVALAAAISAVCMTVCAAEHAKGEVFDKENLVAWCVVPFDAEKRSPQERAAMLKDLGLTKLAYDWRAEHVPQFEEEILALKEQKIELFAFWDTHEEMFRLLEKHNLHPQIWVTVPDVGGGLRDQKTRAIGRSLLDITRRTKELGCKLGLYNHGGWPNDPKNLIRVCEWLRTFAQADHVGIVYNLHHGHEHVEDFERTLKLLEPYLLCLNLNGMNPGANPKILPIGQGEYDQQIIDTILASGYGGPIGILDHRPDTDARISLEENLAGIERLTEE